MDHAHITFQDYARARTELMKTLAVISSEVPIGAVLGALAEAFIACLNRTVLLDMEANGTAVQSVTAGRELFRIMERGFEETSAKAMGVTSASVN